jgi:hypothetical protein
MNQSKVGIVILNYMTYELTLRCVEKLARLAYDDYFLVVVDNQSPNDSGKVLAEAFASGESHGHPVYFLQSDINGGYSAGNNLGIKKAEALGAEYVVVMNNDVEILDQTIISKAVEKFMQDSQIALVGPGIIEKGRLLPPAFPNRPNGINYVLYNLFFPLCVLGLKLLKKRKPKQQRARLVYSVSGSFMILRMDHLKSVGYFDESVFLFGEELILGETLYQHDFKAYYWPEIKIDHQHSMTINNQYKTRQKANLLGESMNTYFSKIRLDLNPILRKMIELSIGFQINIYAKLLDMIKNNH